MEATRWCGRIDKLSRVSVAGLCATLLAACSIVGPRSQELKIASEPSGAQVLVDGEYRGTTPAKVRVRRNRDIIVEVRKEGYEAFLRELESDTPSTLGMLDIIGGWLFLVPFVGLLSDAAWEYDPSTVTVYLDRLAESHARSEH